MTTRPTVPRLAPLLAALAVSAALALSGCKESAPPERAAPKAVKPPAAPVVTDEGGPWVLRYFSPTTGNLLVAKKPEDVPEGARGQVLVVPDDPKLQGPWLFVADLSNKQGAGYGVRTVDRFAMEKEHAAATAKAEAAKPAAAKGEVVLYKTAWCGYCKKAAAYLDAKGVPYVAKDLERDPGARADMMARAKAAGFPASRLQGVPILAIKGRILTGFSRDAIDAALGG